MQSTDVIGLGRLPPDRHHHHQQQHIFRFFDNDDDDDSQDDSDINHDAQHRKAVHDASVSQHGGPFLAAYMHRSSLPAAHRASPHDPNVSDPGFMSYGTDPIILAHGPRPIHQDRQAEDDDDYDMQDGGAALVLPASFPATQATTMDGFHDSGGFSFSSSDDDHVGNAQQPGSGPSLSTASIPSDWPLHFQLPPPPTPPPLSPLHDDSVGTLMVHQLEQLEDENAEFEDLMQSHLMTLSSPNAISPGLENLDVFSFLCDWFCLRPHDAVHDIVQYQARREILKLAQDEVTRVQYKDLAGDNYDFQGINWRTLGVTRTAARQRRKATYKTFINRKAPVEKQPLQHLQPDRNYFRFSGMNIRRDVRLLHFQLRNILGCSSRSRAFYPSFRTVREIDPNDGSTKVAMAFDNDRDVQVSTLTAAHDILIAGGFSGDYHYRHLDCEDTTLAEGRLTDHQSGITNHVQVHTARRSSMPMAAFASNDYGFRVIDLGTNQLVSQTMYDCIINCSALSPDSRLRVMVGDHQDVFITDAETGHVLQTLQGHSDYGFACDWAPDGWTVATGNQDRTIRVWDARYWKRPVAVMPTELSGARSLQFSPLGSGKRLLVAAEDADYLNIIDAETFAAKQTFDVFGEIGGIAFANGGSDLMALSCDFYRGGLLQLSRCDHGAEDTYAHALWRHRGDSRGPQSYDWLPTVNGVLQRPDADESITQRRRRAYLAYADRAPF